MAWAVLGAATCWRYSSNTQTRAAERLNVGDIYIVPTGQSDCFAVHGVPQIGNELENRRNEIISV